MKVEQELITPKKAEAYLAKNKRNRSLRKHHVAKLARAIEQDEWQPMNPAPIVLNGSELFDGQHRLAAVIEADKGVKMWVARGAPQSVMMSMDTGISRSFTDALKMRGELNAPSLAGAVRQVFMYETEGVLGGKINQRLAPSHGQLLAVLEKHPGIRDAVKRMYGASTNIDMRQTGSPALMSAAFYILHQKEPELADEFFTSLITGADLATGNPILALRRMLVESRRRPRPRVLGACLIKAWNAWVAGETIYLLAWKGAQEPFPEIDS